VSVKTFLTFVICAGLLCTSACSGSGQSSGPHQACTPGETQQCFGPGACNGGQSCLSDGSGFGPCDCGGGASSGSSGAEVGSSGGLDASIDVARSEAAADAKPKAAEVGPVIPPFTGEAPHTPLPQLPYANGVLLTSPKLVTVTFEGEQMQTDLAAFGQSVASSSWWDTVRAGYCNGSGTCIGDGPPGSFVQLSYFPQSQYVDSTQGGPSSLQQWLAGEIANSHLPTPDAQTLYVIYFPKTTRITLDGQVSCSNSGGGFGGYHFAIPIGLQTVAYAVVMECDPEVPIEPYVAKDTLLGATTLIASHEIAESATDMIVGTGYVLDNTDPNNWPWIYGTGGGEAGDLCVDQLGLNEDHTLSGLYTVQRIWSNTQAAQGVDPCVPAPPEDVYFNASPSRSLFELDVGQSVTFEVDAFSSGAMPNWELNTFDASPDFETNPQGATLAPYLSFAIAGGFETDAGPQVTVNNGSKVQVTMTLLRDPGTLLYQMATGWLVSWSFAGPNVNGGHVWPVAVVTPGAAADAGIDAATFGSSRLSPPRPVSTRQRLHR
jgi:hypothetical protein